MFGKAAGFMGKAGKFLMGPWGTALTLGTLAYSLFKYNKEPRGYADGSPMEGYIKGIGGPREDAILGNLGGGFVIKSSSVLGAGRDKLEKLLSATKKHAMFNTGKFSEGSLARVSASEFVFPKGARELIGDDRLGYINKTGKIPSFADGTDNYIQPSQNRFAQASASEIAAMMAGYGAQLSDMRTMIATNQSKAGAENERITRIVLDNPDAAQRVFEQQLSSAKEIANSVAAPTVLKSMVMNTNDAYQNERNSIKQLREGMSSEFERLQDDASRAQKKLAKMEIEKEFDSRIMSMKASIKEMKASAELSQFSKRSEVPQRGFSSLFNPFGWNVPTQQSTRGLMAGKESPAAIDRGKQSILDLTPGEYSIYMKQLVRYQPSNIGDMASDFGPKMEAIFGRFFRLQQVGKPYDTQNFKKLWESVDWSNPLSGKNFKAAGREATQLSIEKPSEELYKQLRIHEETKAILERTLADAMAIKAKEESLPFFSRNRKVIRESESQINKLKPQIEEEGRIIEKRRTELIPGEMKSERELWNINFVRSQVDGVVATKIATDRDRKFNLASVLNPTMKGYAGEVQLPSDKYERNVQQNIYEKASPEMKDALNKYKELQIYSESFKTQITTVQDKIQEENKKYLNAQLDIEEKNKKNNTNIKMSTSVEEQHLKTLKDLTEQERKLTTNYEDAIKPVKKLGDALKGLVDVENVISKLKQTVESMKVSSIIRGAPGAKAFKTTTDAMYGSGSPFAEQLVSPEQKMRTLLASGQNLKTFSKPQDIENAGYLSTMLNPGTSEEDAFIAAFSREKIPEKYADMKIAEERAANTTDIQGFGQEMKGAMQTFKRQALYGEGDTKIKGAYETAYRQVDALMGVLAKVGPSYQGDSTALMEGFDEIIDQLARATGKDFTEEFRSATNPDSSAKIFEDALNKIDSSGKQTAYLEGILSVLTLGPAKTQEMIDSLSKSKDDPKASEGIWGKFMSGIESFTAFLGRGVGIRNAGEPEKKAFGGRIFGEGGPREDKVPAMLSPGEFVIRANSAQRLGYDKLEHMNKKGEIPGFADGGQIEKMRAMGLSSSDIRDASLVGDKPLEESLIQPGDIPGLASIGILGGKLLTKGISKLFGKGISSSATDMGSLVANEMKDIPSYFSKSLKSQRGSIVLNESSDDAFNTALQKTLQDDAVAEEAFIKARNFGQEKGPANIYDEMRDAFSKAKQTKAEQMSTVSGRFKDMLGFANGGLIRKYADGTPEDEIKKRLGLGTDYSSVENKNTQENIKNLMGETDKTQYGEPIADNLNIQKTLIEKYNDAKIQESSTPSRIHFGDTRKTRDFTKIPGIVIGEKAREYREQKQFEEGAIRRLEIGKTYTSAVGSNTYTEVGAPSKLENTKASSFVYTNLNPDGRISRRDKITGKDDFKPLPDINYVNIDKQKNLIEKTGAMYDTNGNLLYGDKVVGKYVDSDTQTTFPANINGEWMGHTRKAFPASSRGEWMGHTNKYSTKEQDTIEAASNKQGAQKDDYAPVPGYLIDAGRKWTDQGNFDKAEAIKKFKAISTKPGTFLSSSQNLFGSGVSWLKTIANQTLGATLSGAGYTTQFAHEVGSMTTKAFKDRQLGPKDLGPITKEVYNSVSEKGLLKSGFDLADTVAGGLSKTAIGVAKLDPIAIGDALAMFVPTSRPVRAIENSIAKTVGAVSKPIVKAAFPLPSKVSKDLRRLRQLVDEAEISSSSGGSPSSGWSPSGGNWFGRMFNELKPEGFTETILKNKEKVRSFVKNPIDSGKQVVALVKEKVSTFRGNNPKVDSAINRATDLAEDTANKAKESQAVKIVTKTTEELFKEAQKNKYWQAVQRGYKYGNNKYGKFTHNKDFMGKGGDTMFADGGPVGYALGGTIGYDPSVINKIGRRTFSENSMHDIGINKSMLDAYRRNTSYLNDDNFDMTDPQNRALAYEMDKQRRFLQSATTGYQMAQRPNDDPALLARRFGVDKNGKQVSTKHLYKGRHPNFPKGGTTYLETMYGAGLEPEEVPENTSLSELKKLIAEALANAGKPSYDRTFSSSGLPQIVPSKNANGGIIRTMHTGGVVNYDGLHNLQKDEIVLPKRFRNGGVATLDGETVAVQSVQATSSTKIDTSNFEAVVSKFISAIDKLGGTNVKIEGIDKLSKAVTIEGLDKLSQSINIKGIENLKDVKLLGAENLKDVKLTGAENLKDVKLLGAENLKDVKLTGAENLKDVKLTGAENLKDVKLLGAENLKDIKIEGLDNLPTIKIDTSNIPSIKIEGLSELRDIKVTLDTKTVTLDSSSLQTALSNLPKGVGADESAGKIDAIMDSIQKQALMVQSAATENMNILNAKQTDIQTMLELKINEQISTEIASLRKDINIVDSKTSEAASKVTSVAQKVHIDISNLTRDIYAIKTQLFSKLG
jgi:hypothetical protein